MGIFGLRSAHVLLMFVRTSFEPLTAGPPFRAWITAPDKELFGRKSENLRRKTARSAEFQD